MKKIREWQGKLCVKKKLSAQWVSVKKIRVRAQQDKLHAKKITAQQIKCEKKGGRAGYSKCSDKEVHSRASGA